MWFVQGMIPWFVAGYLIAPDCFDKKSRLSLPFLSLSALAQLRQVRGGVVICA